MFSYSNKKSSGKHMICDIKEIKNYELLNNPSQISNILNTICDKYNFTILNKVEHQFQPQGLTILYLLSESHISIHTFPEREYFALDIYTCRHYDDNSVYEEIYNYLVKEFQAKKENPTIIDRTF
jgi:S-adenosylmethionine decarboxylase